MILERIFTGLILTTLGVLGVKYSKSLVNNTGRLGWAERNLGSGSTFTVVKIAALLLAIFGMLYTTNLHSFVLEPLLSPLKNALGGSDGAFSN